MTNIDPFSIDPIFNPLRESLNKKSLRHINEAIDTLLLIELALLQLKTTEPWGDLLTQAIEVEIARKPKNGKRVLDLIALKGKFYLHDHQEKAAYDAFKELLEMAENYGMFYFEMEAYIGLMQIQVRLPVEVFDQPMMEYLISRSAEAPLEQKRRFSHALAIYSLARGNYQRCIDLGNLVYDEWRREYNYTEMARISHSVSQAYQLLDDHEAALLWHERAQEAFTYSHDLKHRAILAYNWGFQQLFAKQYSEAEHWMRTAREEYQKLGDQHGAMVAAHGLAMAIAYHETNFHEGLHLLNEAVQYWSRQDNKEHIAHAHHTFAFISHKMGDNQAALEYLRNGLEMYDKLSSNDSSVTITKLMWDLLRKIEDGDDTNDLSPKV